MNLEYFISLYHQEYNQEKLHEVIFEAHLQGFLRYINYVNDLQSDGKITKIMADTKLELAWQQLQLIKVKLGIVDNSNLSN